MLHRILLLCFLIVTGTGYSTSAFDDGHNKPKQTKGLHFIENKGQVTDQHGVFRNDIDFKVAAANGLNLFIGKGQLHYQWVKTGSAVNNAIGTPAEMYRMDVQLLGSSPHATITTEDKLAFHQRYYLSTTGSNGTIARSYHKITYHDVYPNIDWTFYFNDEGKLEHDFVVRPGGNISDIRLQYGGASSLAINKDGSFTTVTSMGTVSEAAPIAYEAKTKREISAGFILTGNLLSFKTAPHNGTLIIDPSIEWSSYFGGADVDFFSDVVNGKNGELYMTGATNSTENIATTGAFQTVYVGGSAYLGNDVVVSKFSISGDCLWSTYYGGTQEEVGKSIACDTNGNIYIAGYTMSGEGIATTGSYQDTKPGNADDYDAFLVKFDTSGARLWATYFGGSQEEAKTSVDVACDKSDHIYLTGNTLSTDLSTTTGAQQAVNAGGADAFLAGFDTDGTLNWSTYYGGSSDDFPHSVATDLSGNLYIAGRTLSPDGIATSGTQQDVIGGGQDAFLAKFNPSGALVWGTYYGAANMDRAYTVTTDDSVHVFIAGTTASTSGIATTATHQEAFGGGGGDGFVARFDSSGLRNWATYYGGTGGESVFGLFYNGEGSIYITGNTTSMDSIATPAAMQPVNGGASDGFISKFDDTNGAISWGSYFGGTDAENPTGISGDRTDNVYIAGRTNSSTGIATTGSYQDAIGGGDYDGFFVRIKDCIAPAAPDTINGAVIVCDGNVYTYSVNATAATSYTWILPAGWVGSSSSDSIAVTFDGSSGILKVVAMNDCDVSDTVSLNITVNPLPATPLVAVNGNVLSCTQTFATYQWNLNGQPVAGAVEDTYTATADGNYTLTVTNENGCSATSEAVTLTGTGIDELAKIGIKVYPNPVNDKVYISLPRNATVSICSIEGVFLRVQAIAPGINSVDMGSYAQGMYILRFNKVNGPLLGTLKVTKTGSR